MKRGKARALNLALARIGVGLAFCAFGFFTVTFLSPIVIVDAATHTATSSVATYSISITSEENVSLGYIVPTAEAKLYAATTSIQYTNTCPAGINIYFSSVQEYADMWKGTFIYKYGTINTKGSDGPDLETNSWGYAENAGDVYKKVPGLYEPDLLVSTNSANVSANSYNIKFGINVNNKAVAGDYHGEVIYTIVPKPACEKYVISWDLNGGVGKENVSYDEIEKQFTESLDLTQYTPPTKEGYNFTGWDNGMTTFTGEETSVDVNQGMSPTVTLTANWAEIPPPPECTILENVGDTGILHDSRGDGYDYPIAKLADKNCWMLENLRLVNTTITPENSDVDANFTIPAPNLNSFNTNQNLQASFFSSTYGALYTWNTATAGSGPINGEAEHSICPKGWRLPNSEEWWYFKENYTFDELDPIFTPGYGGSIWNKNHYNEGVIASYWASNTTSDSSSSWPNMYDFTFCNNPNNKYINLLTTGPYIGNAVRCVARYDE